MGLIENVISNSIKINIMGNKIFVSYKYADSDVEHLDNMPSWKTTTVRDYVDQLETYFDRHSDHIYKGESDGEDLSCLSEDQIWEKLKDRIYDSSVTIVMISPNMKEPGRRDCSQWIPWEVSFSLKETTRSDRTSHTNAILAIVLPDRNGNYDYYLTHKFCGVTIHHTDQLFTIIAENKFNIKQPHRQFCSQCSDYHYRGNVSYIEAVKWCDFVKGPNFYINSAIDRKNNVDDYKITKEV